MEIDFSDREKAARGADFFNALLNAYPYRAIFRPCRPQIQLLIEATTILTQGAVEGENDDDEENEE